MISKAELLARHLARTGAEARVFRAPGRVNLIGEHTDYSGGFCLPAAIDRATLVAASLRDDRKIVVESVDFGETVECEMDALGEGGRGHWSDYCFGVARELRGLIKTGADLTVVGDVPLGAGLSSSASVEVATAFALIALNGVKIKSVDVALLCQAAENNFVGAPCGIMDQFASVHGVRGNAMLIDTQTLEYGLAPVPDSVRLVICNSMVKHSVAGGEYAERRSEVETAARVLRVRELREATPEMLRVKKGAMSAEAFKRARHVITDSARAVNGAEMLRAGDVAAFGGLMVQGHVSFRDDFGASCGECDLLVEIAMGLGGCLGARLTGGGFGGCTVNLVEAGRAEGFAGELREGYLEKSGIAADVYVCSVGDGAGEF